MSSLLGDKVADVLDPVRNRLPREVTSFEASAKEVANHIENLPINGNSKVVLIDRFLGVLRETAVAIADANAVSS